MSKLQPERTGFYPVCQRDYIEPLRMFRGLIDTLYFCDLHIGPCGSESLKTLRKTVELESLPDPSFIIGDALTALTNLRPVDLFFQRRDSGGEGGSELFLLRPNRLPLVSPCVRIDVALINSHQPYWGRSKDMQ